MRGITDDIRFALRQLARRPLFTLVAVATLGLGTGVATAMYTVVDGVVLRPLPFAGADRLVAVCEVHASVARFCVASPPNVEDWAAESDAFEVIGVGRDWSHMLHTGGRGESVASGLATPQLFQALGVRAARGRVLLPEDQREHRAVTVLSHALWVSRFGGDTGIVGRTITLDGAPFEVIGVLPPNLEVPDLERVRLWVPLPFDPRDTENRGWRGFQTYARLAAGVTRAEAQRRLAASQERLGERYPATNAGWGVRVEPLADRLTGAVRGTLFVFLGASLLLLLVACANVAGLLIARGATRFREFAVRAAVGARPTRLFRLVAVESVLLALLGGGTGLLVAVWATDVFLGLMPAELPRASGIAVDGRVLLFAAALTVVAGLVGGVVPALRATRVDLAEAVKQGQQPGQSRGVASLRGALIVTEFALAFTLAAGAGLLARSFARYRTWEPGFDRRGLLTTWVLAPSERYPNAPAVTALFDRLVEELRALPGVDHVGLVSNGPLLGGLETGAFITSAADTVSAAWYDASPGWFATLGLGMRLGRGFSDDDRAGAPRVAIVNEAMAARAWPGRNPLGERLTRPGDQAALEVIGVVPDVPPFTPGRPAEPEVYWPYAQAPRWASFVVLRHRGDAGPLTRALEARLHAIDPDLTVSAVLPLEARVARMLRRPQFNMLLIGAFGAVALLLTGAGVFGVLAASVEGRRREFGVRLAVGASASGVVWMVMREGIVLAATGATIGAVLAFAGARLAANLVPGVAPADAVAFGAAALTLLVAAVTGTWLPARRAGRVDPMTALRAE